MQLQQKLATLLNVRAGEGQIVALVMLFAIFAYLADSFLVTVAYTLFLTTFDASAIPYIYVGISIVGTLASFLYLRAGNRFGLMPTVISSRVVLALIIFLIWLAVQGTPVFWLLIALPILQGVYLSLVATSLWNIAGRLFDLQQAKRLFGLIGASGTIGYMLGGVFAPLFIALWGTANLLGLSVLSMSISIAVGGLIAKRYGYRLDVPEHVTDSAVNAPAMAGGKRPIWRTRYVLQIIIGYILFSITFYFIETIFYARAETIYPSESHLASFLAVFGAFVSLIGLLVETLGTSRFLTRFGVPGLVLLSPISLLVLTALNNITSLFGVSLMLLFVLITATYFAENILNAVDYVALSVLYQPLPSVQRTTVQTLIDGIIGPVATGISGVLLLVILRFLDQSAILWMLLPLIGVWLVMAIRIARAYPLQLKRALRERTLQGSQRIRPDAAGVQVLEASLTNPDPGPVIYALDVWQQLDPEQLMSHLPTLLQHPSPAVQLDVLSRVEQLSYRPGLPAVRQFAEQAEDPLLRGTALQVLLAIGGPPENAEELTALLNTPEPIVRQGVMVGLLRGGELDGILAAGDVLSVLLRSEKPEDRVFAARALGKSGLQSVYRPILRLLADENPQVQRATLQAAGQLNQPRLWPVVIASLGQPMVRTQAVAALVNGGESVLPALKKALASETTLANPEVPLRLARICGRLRLPEAAESLLPLLDYSDNFVRTEAVLALQAIGYRADNDMAQKQIQTELDHAAWLLAALVDLDGNKSDAIKAVQAALVEGLDRLLLRLFAWLSLLYDPVAVRKAQDALGLTRRPGGAVAPEQVAYALEMLDLLVDHRVYASMLPLLANDPPAARLISLISFYPQNELTPGNRLLAIIQGNLAQFTPWLRSIALYALLQQPDSDHRELFTAAAADNHPLVQETAVWCLRQRQAENDQPPSGENSMLVTIEKVLLLKVVELFSDTPDEILVELAERLHEVVIPANTTIFERGERGDSLYIIYSGGVEVFSDGTVLDRLGPRQLFGEMALLDAEPRAASVRTVAETRVLRLDQESFYELMDDRIEIAYGVIHVLLKRLRIHMKEVTRLQNRLPDGST